MRPLRSIRWRLQLWYGLLIAALLVGFGATAYLFERNVRLERIDAELERLIVEINGSLRRSAPGAKKGAPPPPPPPARGVSEAVTGELLSEQYKDRGIYYAIWRKNGPDFTASNNAPPGVPRPDIATKTGARSRDEYREAFLQSNPEDFTLVGKSIAVELADLHRFGWKIAALGLALFGGVLFVGWWLVTRALQPIQDIGAAAEKIASGDLAQRINTKDTDSELGQLAGVLNSTFGRLEAAFAQQARFTADAAHELRTPVTVMLTHVQNGLGSEGLTAEQREAFEACQRAAQRMRRLIESLLALARLDAGQEPIKPTGVDIATVTGECVELVRPLAVARKIAVHTDLSAATCSADVVRMEQVITNLLANAIHHNREVGEVWVRTGRENGDIFVEVADNGPGIGREDLPHIFDRFYRADKARTSTQGRAGLGLAISRAIVEAHGGTIEVASELGSGATFTVRMPA